MAGFTTIINNKRNKALPKLQFRRESPYGFEVDYISRKIENQEFIVELFTNRKFENDKVLEENDQYIIGTEGVITNLKFLKEEFRTDNVFSILISLFEKYETDFVNRLRGDFSGFIYHKPSKTWYVFSNPVNSKNIYYFCDEDYFIFSSELRNISHILHRLGKSVNLDVNGAYLLLTYGFMLEDITLIENVKRLTPGNIAIFKNGKVEISEYFNLRNIQHTTDNKDTIIEKMDYLFSEAVRLEFEKDKEYGYKHIATLSGGLDSRMTILIANKLGYTEQLNMTFSQSDYLDEKIAKKIASDYGHDFMFQSLDNGNYLKKIDKVVFYNDGLVLYSGSAHAMRNAENMNFGPYGMVHSGMIGDAVIGSFLSKPYIVPPQFNSGVYSGKKLNKIESLLAKIVKKYPSEELYKFYTRGFLGAMNGYNYFEIFSQASSPFLEPDFMSYCYSIPENLKYKQKIYLEWIERKHKEFARYPWEKTGVSPLKSLNYKRFFDIGYYRRMSLKFFDKLSGNLKSGMNPYDLWMKNNPGLKQTIDTYFNTHICLTNNNVELQNDCIDLFNNGNTGEKTQVLTLLSAIKLHNLHI